MSEVVRVECRRAILGEQREGMILPITVEFRDGSDPNSGVGPDHFTMTGHAAVFNSLSEDLGGFKEIIQPGAFRDAARTSLIHLLWNHDTSRPLASTDSNSLQVQEDQDGLRVFAKIPKALSYANDIRALYGAGIARGMSFSFTMPSDGSGEAWTKMADGTPLRTLTRVGELFDVSPVTRGAYAQPAFSMRTLLEARTELGWTDDPSATEDHHRDVESSGGAPIEQSESAGGDQRSHKIAAMRAQVALALSPER